VDQILAEVIQAGLETLNSEKCKHTKVIWNKEELPHQQKESIVMPIHKKGDKIDCTNYQGVSLLSNSYKIYSTFFCLGWFRMQMKLLGIINVDFDVIGQRRIRFSVSVGYWRKSGSYNGTVH
jgi:hypothetical protein